MEAKIKSEAFNQFNEATRTIFNPVLQNWKAQDGEIEGYFCYTVPEELITAAGQVPFRMRATGSTSTEESDAYYSSINCSFPRHCFNMALINEYKFLDGIICVNSCDHIRRIFDNWTRFVPGTPFVEVMSLPRKTEAAQVAWYRDEINLIRGELEKHYGVKISDETLRKAI